MKTKLPNCACGGKLKSYGRSRPDPRWVCAGCGKVYTAAMVNLRIMDLEVEDIERQERGEPPITEEEQATAIKQSPAEAEFHKRRRMFACCQGNILLAPPDLTKGHRHWLKAMGLAPSTINRIMADELRGFALDGDLYCYVGDDFHLEISAANGRDLRIVVGVVARAMELDGTVYGGMEKGEEGKLWKPLHNLGACSVWRNHVEPPLPPWRSPSSSS